MGSCHKTVVRVSCLEIGIPVQVYMAGLALVAAELEEWFVPLWQVDVFPGL